MTDKSALHSKISAAIWLAGLNTYIYEWFLNSANIVFLYFGPKCETFLYFGGRAPCGKCINPRTCSKSHPWHSHFYTPHQINHNNINHNEHMIHNGHNATCTELPNFDICNPEICFSSKILDELSQSDYVTHLFFL